jgi:hypothetical protein
MKELAVPEWIALIFSWVIGIVVIIKFIIPDLRRFWNEGKKEKDRSSKKQY